VRAVRPHPGDKEKINKDVTHVERIIVVKQELELSGKVTNGAGHEAKEDSGRRPDVTSTRCDSNETRYCARAETND